MPPAPLTGNTVTRTCDQAGPPGSRGPAPVPPGHDPRWTLAEALAGRLRRVAGLLRRMANTGVSSYDPLFERPDLIEDDYYRLRNQPRG